MRRPALKLANGYRSGLEAKIGEQLEAAGVDFSYETLKLPYEVPARKAKYTPDFSCAGGIILEAKGWFKSAAERQKLVLVKQQHPHLDIRLVFQNARTPIYKGAPTTYAKWAEDHGFPWCDKGTVPDSWLRQMQEKNGSLGAHGARARRASRARRSTAVAVRRPRGSVAASSRSRVKSLETS